ncbi:MAG: methionyl-tRNA formyltransferase [Ruminococcus sp.]|nr:methionyl-tRNA formyltransferase [Ruminococcus sp.]
MNIVYMGTPDFAVPALEALASDPAHTVLAVFTQPDKPRGRKMILTPPDVKVCAQRLNIPVYQPASMRSDEAFEQLAALKPDVIVVAAYGQILPKSVLDLPVYGCVNIHGSLLPKYRGASPIQQAVLNGDRVTGVTTMLMDVGLDTGDILLTKETAVGENETSAELFDRLSVLGGELITETLDALESGTVTPRKQDEALATHTTKIDKSMSPVDFTATAQEVHNLIRGLYSWPMATMTVGGKRVKIHKARMSDKSGRAGEILSVKPLIIACSKGAVEILELQPEGKKKMTAEAFAAGHKLTVGESVL